MFARVFRCLCHCLCHFQPGLERIFTVQFKACFFPARLEFFGPVPLFHAAAIFVVPFCNNSPLHLLISVIIFKPMNEIVAESGIPIPPPSGRGGAIVPILKSMKVGDFVVLEIKRASSWIGSARQIGMRVATRKISDAQSRVWRIS